MNKVKFEHNGMKISLSSSKESIQSLIDSASKMYKNCCSKTNTVPDFTEIKEPIHIKTGPSLPFDERPAFRDRLPNNTIDVKDLNVKQAIKENTLVRCPHCGQAHCLAISSGAKVYFMEKQYTSNEFGIIAEFDSLNDTDFIKMCCENDTDKKLYFTDLQSVKTLTDCDFAVDNNTEIFCPICHISDVFSAWKDAFENPLSYFETEQLCDACGGEKLPKLIRKKKVYCCDKCGLITEYKE